MSLWAFGSFIDPEYCFHWIHNLVTLKEEKVRVGKKEGDADLELFFLSRNWNWNCDPRIPVEHFLLKCVWYPVLFLMPAGSFIYFISTHKHSDKDANCCTDISWIFTASLVTSCRPFQSKSDTLHCHLFLLTFSPHPASVLLSRYYCKRGRDQWEHCLPITCTFRIKGTSRGPVQKVDTFIMQNIFFLMLHLHRNKSPFVPKGLLFSNWI